MVLLFKLLNLSLKTWKAQSRMRTSIHAKRCTMRQPSQVWPSPMPSSVFLTPWPTRSVRNSTPSTDGPMPSCFHTLSATTVHAQLRQLHGLSTTTTVQMKIPRYRSYAKDFHALLQKKPLKLTQSCIRTR